MKPWRPSNFADAVPVDNRGRRTPLCWSRSRALLLFESAAFYWRHADREIARLLRVAYRGIALDAGAATARSDVPGAAQGQVGANAVDVSESHDAIPSERTIRASVSRSRTPPPAFRGPTSHA